MFRAALFAALVAAGPAFADDVVSAQPDRVAVTLYHDGDVSTDQLLHGGANSWIHDQGLAFVTETRTIDLPAGPAVVKFRGVAATMVPQTGVIEGLPNGVLEQNFDYDLLSPGSLLAKSIGQTVRLVRADTKTGKLKEEDAIVRSGPNGAVLEIDGKLEALHCSGLPEKLVFERVPEGLADTPTLSVRTDAPAAGHYTITLSYIATGFNWSADYVARLDDATGKLALTGWLTLANFSSTSFPDAPVDVVAGNLATTGTDKPVQAAPLYLATSCWPTKIDWSTHRPPPFPPPPPPPMAAMAFEGRTAAESVIVTGSRIAAQNLGDYKLYALPEATTVAARQTKQIQFLDQPDVSYERLYRYDVTYDSRNPGQRARANVLLRLRNEADAGLGKPLPAGSIAVFEPASDGSEVFAGQDSVRDISVGLPIEVTMGRAMNIRVAPRLVESSSSGHGRDTVVTDSWDIDLANDKPAPITLELRQDLYRGEARITSESRAHTESFGRAVWTFALASGDSAELRYTVSHPQ